MGYMLDKGISQVPYKWPSASLVKLPELTPEYWLLVAKTKEKKKDA